MHKCKEGTFKTNGSWQRKVKKEQKKIPENFQMKNKCEKCRSKIFWKCTKNPPNFFSVQYNTTLATVCVCVLKSLRIKNHKCSLKTKKNRKIVCLARFVYFKAYEWKSIESYNYGERKKKKRRSIFNTHLTVFPSQLQLKCLRETTVN
jgi:hypothetical protein